MEKESRCDEKNCGGVLCWGLLVPFFFGGCFFWGGVVFLFSGFGCFGVFLTVFFNGGGFYGGLCWCWFFFFFRSGCLTQLSQVLRKCPYSSIRVKHFQYKYIFLILRVEFPKLQAGNWLGLIWQLHQSSLVAFHFT